MLGAVDQDWKCWLLEANAEPDFKQTGGRLRHVIENLMEGVMELVVDPIAGKVLSEYHNLLHQPNASLPQNMFLFMLVCWFCG